MICASRNASTTPRIETSATSFWSAMKSFRSGGPTRRTACGRITWRSAWPSVSPIASAASRWPAVDRGDPGPVDLGHVGAVRERQRDPAEHDRVRGQAGQLQRRDAEPDQVDQEDHRHAAEDVDEDRRQQPQRETARRRGWSGSSAIDEPDDQHRDLDHAEHLDVEPERREHVRERVLERAPREERVADVGPARARHGERDETAEHDHRRHRRRSPARGGRVARFAASRAARRPTVASLAVTRGMLAARSAADSGTLGSAEVRAPSRPGSSSGSRSCRARPRSAARRSPWRRSP